MHNINYQQEVSSILAQQKPQSSGSAGLSAVFWSPSNYTSKIYDLYFNFTGMREDISKNGFYQHCHEVLIAIQRCIDSWKSWYKRGLPWQMLDMIQQIMFLDIAEGVEHINPSFNPIQVSCPRTRTAAAGN